MSGVTSRLVSCKSTALLLHDSDRINIFLQRFGILLQGKDVLVFLSFVSLIGEQCQLLTGGGEGEGYLAVAAIIDLNLVLVPASGWLVVLVG